MYHRRRHSSCTKMLLSRKEVVLFFLICSLGYTFGGDDGHDHGSHDGHDHGSHDGHDHGSHDGHDHSSHTDHDSGDDHGDHEGHSEGDDHDDHTGHDHTGLPHGHGDIDQNCPEDDDHDHATHESQGGDPEAHDHSSHGDGSHGGHDDHGHGSHGGHDDHGHGSHGGHDDHGHGPHGMDGGDDDGHASHGGHDDHGHGSHDIDGDDDDHGHSDPHDHTAHGHEGWDGGEGACPATELHFDEKDAYYELMEKSPSLLDITLCTYFTTDSNGVGRGVIVSIHTPLKNKNLIIVGGMERKKPFIRFVLEGRTRKISTQFQPNTEVHMCMVSSVAGNTVKVYINGQKRLNDIKFPILRNLPKGGTVRFGRSKDNKHPMYGGTLRNFMLWGKMLTDEEIGKIYGSNYCPGDAIIVPLEDHIIPLKANVASEACPKNAYTFDNTGDKVEYLESGQNLPTLKYFTVCAQVTTNIRGIIPGTIASYGTKEQPDLLSIGGEIGKDGKPYTRFVVGGQAKLMNGQFKPSTSYRFCMVYHMPHKHLMTYINGRLSIMTTFENIDVLPGGGTTIIGQRQRKLGGCFDRDQAYNGRLEDFMIWTRAFSEGDIAAYAAGKCPIDSYITTERKEVVPHGRFYEYATCSSTEFTLNNQGNVLEYVDVSNSLPESDYITVCAKVVTNGSGIIPGTVASYSTDSVKQSLIVGGRMGADGPELQVTLNGDTIYAKGQYAPNTRYHFCISFHTSHGHAITYINGRFVRDFHFHDASSIPSGGKVIVGQTQNCPGGCFDRSSAYTGKVSHFMVWNRALSLEEMEGMAMSDECPNDQIVDLSPGNAAKASSTIGT